MFHAPGRVLCSFPPHITGARLTARAKLEIKEALVAKLKELNNQAEAGMHTDEQGRQSDALQLLYTQVQCVRVVCGCG